ncbi:MAG: alanine racemase [Firmicutes bacterium]|nr:alanine racemase [Bacillota bacterium]
MNRRFRPTEAIVDLTAIQQNTAVLRTMVPKGTQLCAVVKANGYGHGAAAVARSALSAGASWLAVATLEEAIELREAGIRAPLLVFGSVDPRDCGEAVAREIALTLLHPQQVEAVAAAVAQTRRCAHLHLKVDTGMGRLGTRAVPDAVALAQRAREAGMGIEGLYTHLATADERDPAFTDQQVQRFQRFRQALAQQGWRPVLHVCNSAGVQGYPQYAFHLVRPGIAVYGYPPRPEGAERFRPALSLITHIVYLKELEAGSSVSYGRTFVARRKTRVATLPIGYADGVPRLLSNRGWALVRGQRVPIIGRICMDQLMLDVTDLPQVALGDRVTLLGEDGEERITADDWAAWAQTIPYEILCGLSVRIPRTYIHAPEG